MVKRSPPRKTIIRVIEHLEEHGLSVYGPCVNVETGQEFESCMDFKAEQVVKYIRLLRKDKIWREGDE